MTNDTTNDTNSNLIVICPQCGQKMWKDGYKKRSDSSKAQSYKCPGGHKQVLNPGKAGRPKGALSRNRKVKPCIKCEENIGTRLGLCDKCYMQAYRKSKKKGGISVKSFAKELANKAVINLA